jgi:enamine deaminase RidA (YjgF/YER057c/UK114 family)
METAMDVKHIHPGTVAKPSGVWTPAILVTQPGQLVFLSGFTSRDEAGNVVGVGDISAQTEQVCKLLQNAMRAAGGELKDIVRVDVFVRDIEQFDAIHAVRRRYFPNNAPVSTMVQVSRMVDDRSLIEINAIGVLPYDKA